MRTSRPRSPGRASAGRRGRRRRSNGPRPVPGPRPKEPPWPRRLGVGDPVPFDELFGRRHPLHFVAHAVLVDVAVPRLQKSEIKELVTTNSTPVRTIEGFSVQVQCVSELLGEGMKRIHNDESVSSLFKIDNGKT